VVDKIREALRRPFDLDGHEVTVTASIGMTIYPDDGFDADTLIKYADTAMYSAKEAGRDAFRFFTAEMNAQSLARLDLENALRRAIDNHEFVLYLQPKVHIGSGRISGAEALIRWKRPGHGMVSPALFIPVLEETGLIVPVGTWVLNEACRMISKWGKSKTGPVHLSVNVSGVQFFLGGLEEEVLNAIKVHEIAPELLELELTESSLMSNAEDTITVLRNLKALGIKISIDDFGTGYSSLAYLKRFPIDKLKIDIAFVRAGRAADAAHRRRRCLHARCAVGLPVPGRLPHSDRTDRGGRLRYPGAQQGACDPVRPVHAAHERDRIHGAGQEPVPGHLPHHAVGVRRSHAHHGRHQSRCD
jgi:predicted signal transduction protein with EAL and GGDEF domain